jgi:hypothetical protein
MPDLVSLTGAYFQIRQIAHPLKKEQCISLKQDQGGNFIDSTVIALDFRNCKCVNLDGVD